MFVVELSFPAGRFHATPWGRHVNEGVPEWPPSPYRLVRGLFDVWKRKRPDWQESRIEPLLAALASSPPRYRLPPASASHTRSFLSENKKDETARQLIFDAFVAVDPTETVLIGWPDAELDEKASVDLNELFSLMNYLGRSESWVSAQVLQNVKDVHWNCRPEDGVPIADDTESLPVSCPISPRVYADKPYVVTTQTRRRGKSVKGVQPTKTVSWMDALAWSTADLLASRRSEPPAYQSVSYLRSRRCFDVAPARIQRRQRPVHGVLYALESKVLPPVVSTLEIAERFRRRLMGIHKAIVGDPGPSVGEEPHSSVDTE